MNEASSKYVDNIAVEKLLMEKLNNVHHFPEANNVSSEIKLEDLNQISSPITIVQLNDKYGTSELKFNSYVKTDYPENDEVKCIYYASENKTIIGDLIFVHGLYEDNLQLYQYFFSQLNNKGINVYLLILPFHYMRKPSKSLFSGEYFWSGNIFRSILAFKQGVYDLYSIYQYLQDNSNNKIAVSGFSMGGGIVLSLVSYVNIHASFIINPISNISSLVWNSKLFSAVKNDFQKAGLDYDIVKYRFKEFELMDRDTIATDINNIFIGISKYDQINEQENYDMIINSWLLRNINYYKAGHLNIFRVPKLASDIEKILIRE